MIARLFTLLLLLMLASLSTLAGEVTADIFAKTPEAVQGEFGTPRSIVADPATGRFFVLDSGQARVMAMTFDGQQTGSWSLRALGAQTPLPADPLLPMPSLAVAGDTVYFLNFDRAEQRVELVTLDGPGDPRTVYLPEKATNGAVTLDNASHVLAAYISVTGGEVSLVLAREGVNGKVNTIDTLSDPCEGQEKDLVLTGFAVSPNGQFAVGIAQSGSAAYSFVRSWLIQGTLRDGAIRKSMEVTHRFSLLDSLGHVQERFRSAVTLAGRYGYPAKACVPLFTALVLGPDGTVISGGHTLDPFLRIYDKEEALLRSVPRQSVVGGQHLAILPGKDGARLFGTAPAQHRIQEYSMDGRIVGGFGSEAPYNLAQPVSIAASPDSVYVAVRGNTGYQLVCFSGSGRYCWMQPLAPPAKLAQAQPLLTATSGDRVLIGWRLPRASGIAWVETVMEDGTPGLPLWSDPVTTINKSTYGQSPSPLITGQDGRVYVLRETKEGLRLYAFSATGAFLLNFPTTMQGITIATETGSLAWAHPDGDGMIIVPYTAQGVAQGWKRVPRPARNARLLPVPAGSIWGWLTSTNSLLKLDANLTVVDEATVIAPDGQTVESPAAVTSDGEGKIYFAFPNHILVVGMQ